MLHKTLPPWGKKRSKGRILQTAEIVFSSVNPVCLYSPPSAARRSWEPPHHTHRDTTQGADVSHVGRPSTSARLRGPEQHTETPTAANSASSYVRQLWRAATHAGGDGTASGAPRPAQVSPGQLIHILPHVPGDTAVKCRCHNRSLSRRHRPRAQSSLCSIFLYVKPTDSIHANGRLSKIKSPTSVLSSQTSSVKTSRVGFISINYQVLA